MNSAGTGGDEDELCVDGCGMRMNSMGWVGKDELCGDRSGWDELCVDGWGWDELCGDGSGWHELCEDG